MRDYVQSTRAQVAVDVDGLGPTLFCHGSPRSDEECVTVATPAERVEEFTAEVSEACIVTAHTHMQYDRRVGERRLLNPGSVGLPYELEPGNAYWALLGPEVELRRTPYDLDAAIERMRAAGMPKFDGDRGADAHAAAAGRGDRARRTRRFLRLDSAHESDGRREAGGREGNAARPLRRRRLPGLPARPLLLGRAARPRPPGREGPSAPHLARHLADRAGCRRACDAAPRHSIQAHPRRARSRGRGRRGGAEGLVPPARGHGRRLRLHRRRNRDHRLSLDAALHRRRGAAVPRDARLLESRPRVGGVPRRARGARAANRRAADRS